MSRPVLKNPFHPLFLNYNEINSPSAQTKIRTETKGIWKMISTNYSLIDGMAIDIGPRVDAHM